MEPAPVRMDELAVLPIFLKLEGKRAVLAGGTAPAVWKAELLSAAGATVEVFDPAPCADLVALAAHPPRGSIVLVRRVWSMADIEHAAIAIGATEDEAEAAEFRDAARRMGVPVNVVDKPAYCDFQFGTIVNRSPLVIGISTDGAAPVFGQAIRTLIEALLPQALKGWAEAARAWRPAVQGLRLDFRERRRFWEAFTARAFGEALPTEADRDALLALVSAGATTPEPGRVILVGAGPAGSDEVTLGAVRALQGADLVFHAAVIPDSTIGLARREAIKTSVAIAEDPVDLIVQACGPGKRIAWLDRGNPVDCWRWSIRADALSTRGLVVESAPGIGPCEACHAGCPAWRAPLSV